MKLSEVLTQAETPAEAPKTVKMSEVLAASEPQAEKTVFVPETGKVLGYAGDRNYDEIRFDVEISELKKDPSDFFGMVDMGTDLVKGIGKGIAQFGVQQLPQALAGLQEEAYARRAKFEVFDIYEAMTGNPLAIEKLTALASPQGREQLRQQSESMTRLADRIIEKTNEIEAIQTEEGAETIGAALGSGVASLATSLALYRITKSKAIPSILFGQIAKGGATTRARLAGKSIEERSAISSLVGLGEGALEALALDTWVKLVRGNTAIANALRIGGRAIAEGVTEYGQELSGETIQKLSGVSDLDWAEIHRQAVFAGMIGLLVGGSVATIVNFSEGRNKAIAPLRKAGLNDVEIEQVYEAVAKKAQQRATPEIEAAVTREMMEADKTIQEKKKSQEVTQPQKKTVRKEGLIDLYKRTMSAVTARRVANAKGERASKIAKGDGMKQSALIRRMKGEPTEIEMRNALKQLDSNYIGKTVQTPKGEGEIASAPAFGRFKVKYADGAEISVPNEDIKSSPATKDEAVEKLRSEAVENARQELELFVGIKQADQPAELETIVEEVQETAPKTQKEASEDGKPKKTSPQPEKGTKTGIPKAIPTTKAAQKPLSTPGGEKVESSAYAKMLEETKGDVQKQKSITAVLDGLEMLEGESAIYTRMNLADQAALGIKFVNENPEAAKRIALGLEPPPPNVSETAISLAYAEMLKNKGDMKGLMDARRARMLRQRRRGQEIVMERGRVSEHSPDHFMELVLEARMRMAGKQLFEKPTFRQGDTNQTQKQRGAARISEKTDALVKAIDKKSIDMAEAQKLIDGIIC